jgi:hypothetical protein
METGTQGLESADSASSAGYATKTDVLQRRVNAAAQAISDKGVRPTVTRIRAALGGGSPNDLAPALKHWKESVRSTTAMDVTDHGALPRIPIQIADLAHELWQRANVAAAVELKGGSGARAIAIRTEDEESLRNQVTALRDQLQRESLAFGELRAQAARYEAMAHNALTRADEAEVRERKHFRHLGSARQRIAELEATVSNLRERAADASRSPRRRPSAATHPPRPSKLVKGPEKSARRAKTRRKKARVISRRSAIRKRRSGRRVR